MVNYVTLFEDWKKKVTALEATTDENGLFYLSTFDYFQIMENCPPEHLKHYLLHFLVKVKFLLDESIVLTNGQLAFAYQLSMYKNFIFDDADIHTSFFTGLKQSARTTPFAKLSCCSWEGLEYLAQKKIKRLNQGEKLQMQTLHDSLQESEQFLKRLVESELLRVLKANKAIKKVTVTMLKGAEEISYQYGTNYQHIRSENMHVSGPMYPMLAQREIPNLPAYAHGQCTARVEEEARQKSLEVGKPAWKQEVEKKAPKISEFKEFVAKASPSNSNKVNTPSSCKASKKSPPKLDGRPSTKGITSNLVHKQNTSFSSVEDASTMETVLAEDSMLDVTQQGRSDSDEEFDDQNLEVVKELFTAIPPKVRRHPVQAMWCTPTKDTLLPEPSPVDNSESSSKFSGVPSCLRLSTDLVNDSDYRGPNPSVVLKRKKLVKVLVNEDDNSSSSSPDIIALASKTKKVRTTYVKAEYAGYNTEVAMFMTNALEANKQLVNSAATESDSLVPTDPTERKEWVERESRKADKTLMSSLFQFVYQSLALITVLETAVIDYVVRMRELRDCAIDMIVEVQSWHPIFDVVSSKFKDAIDERDELEVEAIERAAEQRIRDFVEKCKQTAASNLMSNDVEEMGSASSELYNSIAQYDARSLEEFKQLVATETKAAKQLIVAARKNTIRNLNAVVHNALIKTVCFQAQAQQCMDQIPPEMLKAFARLISHKDYSSAKGAEHLRRFQKCVAHIKVKPEEMKKLVCQIVAKAPRTALKESPAKPPSPAGMIGKHQSVQPLLVGSTTEAELTAANASLLPGQTKLTSYYDATSHWSTSASQQISDGTAFHLSSVVTSFDEAFKVIMRNVSCNYEDRYFVGLDASSCKRQDIINRLKLFALLLSSVVQGETFETLCSKFADDDVLSTVKCLFAVSADSSCTETIRADGLCYYRTLYQLSLRHYSLLVHEELSLKAMTECDRKINCLNGEAMPEHVDFLNFLEGIGAVLVPSQHVDDSLTQYNTDHTDFEETADLVVRALRKRPGCFISAELWGVNLWTKTVCFPATLFTACSRSDNTAIAAKLYSSETEMDHTKQWHLYAYSSTVKEDFFSLSLLGVAKLLKKASFMSFHSSHFFLLPFPSEVDAAHAVDEITETIVKTLLQGVNTVERPQDMLASLTSIIDTLCNSGAGGAPDQMIHQDFDLRTLHRNLAALWPDAAVNHHVEVVDLIKDVVARTPAKKSVEHQTIEILETKVKHLEARCRAYKRLLNESTAVDAQRHHASAVLMEDGIE